MLLIIEFTEAINAEDTDDDDNNNNTEIYNSHIVTH